MRLWDKGAPLDRLIHGFTVGRDPELDHQLLYFDCLGSMAHGAMLGSIGILTPSEVEGIRRALFELVTEHEAGNITIRPEDEDSHTVIEAFLTERLGEAGKKIHTGRSRNDQVILATRLYAREQLIGMVDILELLASTLLDRAVEGYDIPMPGYTHMRQAMPSTVGHLLTAYAEAVIRGIELLQGALSFINRNPLGSASGYGVPLPLDRSMVADLLGFDGIDRNALYVQNTRGKAESIIISALLQLQTDFSRCAFDLILFSSEEFGFFKLPDAFTTGSSIMPQKRNPDVLELVRGSVSRMQARFNEVITTISHLPSGYQRDLQLTKAPLLESLEIVSSSAVVMTKVIEGLEVDEARCRSGFHPAIFDTDRALQRVLSDGIPFRQAYKEAEAFRGTEEQMDLDALLDLRTHAGAPRDRAVAQYRTLLQSVMGAMDGYRLGAAKARSLLAG